MKSLRLTFIFALFITSYHQLSSQEKPTKESVLANMELANDYFMAKWPDPGVDIVTDKRRPSNLWTRATYYEGLMALYYINQDKKLYDYAVDWGESHDWRPTYGDLNISDADFYCCGQTYLELYQIERENKRIIPMKTVLDNIKSRNGVADWSWIDAIQMGMPVFTKMGVILKDTSYFKQAHEMYMYSKTQHGTNGLYNTEEHLWYRDADFDPPFTTPNGKSCYWSRGNGWVIAALARVLDVLPDTSSYRDEYITTLKEMSEALLAVQREDGFWNSSLFDENDYGGKETSGTAFFAYGFAWGMNNGILDSATYYEPTMRAWNGMVNNALHDNGFLGWMQGTGKQPSDGQPLSYTKEPNFEDYGLGAFLLAGSEVYKLVQNSTVGVDDKNAQALDFKAKPNPASGFMEFQFAMPEAGEVKLSVYDALGKEISTVSEHFARNGKCALSYNVSGMKKGYYIASLQTGNESVSNSFIVN